MSDAARTVPPARPTYWLTRFVILRLLGLVYVVAFATFVLQGPALLGAHGLEPAADYLPRVAEAAGSRAHAAFELPSLFWLDASDGALRAVGIAGLVLSVALLLGLANVPLLFLLWALYMSIVHVGQTWYSFGWEIQLLETGFLAIFLCPLLDPRPFPRLPPPPLVIALFRWLIARIMIGAGLIKLRGDSCWRDLSCLDFHYETQPIPNPLSRLLHFMPRWTHRAGVLFNHVAELVAPILLVVPARAARHVAGAIFVLFQLVLIASGNLSFLNWLTIVPALACFDDRLLTRVLPGRLAARAAAAARDARPSRAHTAATVVLTAVVGLLSLAPVANLLSGSQVMNTSFEPLHLVNTYGAFGVVGRERLEIVLEGIDADVADAATTWKPYEFRCKPGDPRRRPCVVSPYHLRLDWLMWFAAMSTPDEHPWAVHLVAKLLQGDAGARGLLARDPFAGGPPPRFIRAELYRYRFAPRGDPSGAWWIRERVGAWLPPLSLDDPRLARFLALHGWTIGDGDGDGDGGAPRRSR